MMLAVVFGLGMLFLAGLFVYSWFSAGPYTPIPRAKLVSLVEQVPMQSGQTLVDLGAGDGRVLTAFAQRYGARSIGYEIQLLACVLGWLRIAQSKSRTQISLRWGDMYRAQLRDADVVFLHILPHGMGRFMRIFYPHLKSGARILTFGVPLTGLQIKQTLTLPGTKVDLYPNQVYLYQVG